MKTFVTKFKKEGDETVYSGPNIIAPDSKSAKKHLELLKENYPNIEIAGELVEILNEGEGGGKQILHG
jgi:hypothetical protein